MVVLGAISEDPLCPSHVGGRACGGLRHVLEGLLNWALETRDTLPCLCVRTGILKTPRTPGMETQFSPGDPQILVTTLPEALLSRQR